MDVGTQISVDRLKSRIEDLENTVIRLDSLIKSIESKILNDSINTTTELESLKKSQTGPRKFLYI